MRPLIKTCYLGQIIGNSLWKIRAHLKYIKQGWRFQLRADIFMCTIDPHLLLTSLTNTCFSLLFYLLLLSLAWSPNNNNNTMHHWSPLQPITNLQTQICTNQNQDLSFVSTYLFISFYLSIHRNEYLFSLCNMVKNAVGE